MGIIHFQETLVEKAMETIKDAQDLSDVAKDLKEVQIGLDQVRYSNLLREVDDSEKLRKLQQARILDNILRRKYPTIDIMLTLADKMPKTLSSPKASGGEPKTTEYQLLEQDYYGILCDTLLKKKVTDSIEAFIKSVE